MLVSLPNGRTVDMPFDDYLHMGKEGYQYLMAQNLGAPIEYPFFGSVLHHKGADEEEEIQDEEEVDNSFFEEE